jgi:hypothetical protein
MSDSRSAVSTTNSATCGRTARMRRKNARTSAAVTCLGGEDFVSSTMSFPKLERGPAVASRNPAR